MPSGPQESNNQKTNEEDSEITPQPSRFRTSFSNCVSLQSLFPLKGRRILNLFITYFYL